MTTSLYVKTFPILSLQHRHTSYTVTKVLITKTIGLNMYKIIERNGVLLETGKISRKLSFLDMHAFPVRKSSL